MKKNAILLVLCAVLCTINLSGQNPPCSFQQLEGSWVGKVTEGNLMYNTEVNFDCVNGINVQYSDGLSCSGTWTLNSVNANVFTFTENIAPGMGCNSIVPITLTVSGDELLVEYLNNGSTVASSTLTRLPATVPPAAVPTLSQWGLITLAIIILIFGVIAIKQRTLIVEYN